MKIICTQEEKTVLVELIGGNEYICPFNFNLNMCSNYEYCKNCVANEIEWQIEDGDQE